MVDCMFEQWLIYKKEEGKEEEKVGRCVYIYTHHSLVAGN